jgi:hypothetical protein
MTVLSDFTSTVGSGSAARPQTMRGSRSDTGIGRSPEWAHGMRGVFVERMTTSAVKRGDYRDSRFSGLLTRKPSHGEKQKRGIHLD